MADDGSSIPARRGVLDVFLLDRTPVVLRIVLVGVVIVGCAAFAEKALSLQHHFAQVGGGRVAHLLAAGATPATAWTGWAAAAFFAIAVARLRRDPPEPPAGRTPVEVMTPLQIRAGLLREYTLVRLALDGLTLVALLDVARTVRYVFAANSGDVLAAAALQVMVVEALGLVAAAAVLSVWALTFRGQLRRLGAL